MRIEEVRALVSGANRGLGRAICQALVARGAARVYAGARNPAAISDSGLIACELDITDEHSVAAAAKECSDVNLLVNNAGIARMTPFLGPATEADTRDLMETNFFGTMRMCRTFAPVLAGNGGGVLVNVLSIASFFSVPPLGALCATKAALWSLTNVMRMELRDQRTRVLAVHASFIDTDMTAGFDVAKLPPGQVADAILDGVVEGREEVLVGDRTVATKAALSRDQELIYPQVERDWRDGRFGADDMDGTDMRVQPAIRCDEDGSSQVLGGVESRKQAAPPFDEFVRRE